MPSGNYSHAGQNQGTNSQYAITEPKDQWGVQAKEPDRQSPSHPGTQSGRRSGMESGYEQEDMPRGRSSQKASSGRGTQSRRATDRTETMRRTAGPDARTGRSKKSRRGFAAMSSEQQREIARKGGLTVSRNRRHMADIGRVGGEHSHGGRRARR
jgi:general stress protein YciG